MFFEVEVICLVMKIQHEEISLIFLEFLSSNTVNAAVYRTNRSSAVWERRQIHVNKRLKIVTINVLTETYFFFKYLIVPHKLSRFVDNGNRCRQRIHIFRRRTFKVSVHS